MPVEVVAIFGPTASGKSSLAEALADTLATEVVSADALQVYRGLPILTNQPRRPTRLVGIRSLDEEMSVGEYAVLAHEAVDELVERTGFAVVAGGTGLYFRAALADLRVPSPPGPERRRRWEETYDADPLGAHRLLAAADAAAAAAIHVNDRRRVVRALELAEVGESLTVGAARLWDGATRRPTRIVGLDVAAEELSRRIVERTESMLARGVVSEARAAARGTVSRTAAQALGLRDLLELPEAEAAERIVARTRRYAAYQRKWMRRIPGIVMVGADRPPGEVADDIVALARTRERLPRR
jgi:tRNA dimethylallyltransferase